MIADNNKSQSSSDVTSNNDNPNNNNQCTSDVTSNNDNPNNNNQPTSAVTPKDNNHQTTATVATAPATPTHESTSLVKQFLQLLKPSSNESCYSEVSYVECYYPVVKLLFSQIPLHLYGCVINVS